MWSTRSELFTDSRAGHTQRPGFPVLGRSLTRVRIRLFLSAATALVCVWSTPGSAAGAEPDVDAGAGAGADAGAEPQAPPPLSKPPRLLRFVEAATPASLGEGGRADVVLTIDVDAQGKVTDVAVVKSTGPEASQAAVAQAAVAAVRQFTFEPGEAG